MGFNQNDRLLKMTGPFGDDEVFVTSFSGSESISRLFAFQVEFFSTKLSMKAADLIGKSVTIEVEQLDDKGNRTGLRYFNGMINRLRAGNVGTEANQDYRSYRIEVVPAIWFLTQTSRCFMFLDMSIKDIIESVLNRGENHISPVFDDGGIGSLGSRVVEMCIQYRETDFNFLSRIFEQYGVYYYFKHTDGGHEMVLGMDANYATCDEATVLFPGHVGGITDNCVNSWEHSYEFVPGKWSHTDYDFKKPLTDLETNSPKISPGVAPDVPSYEMYDYPGEYIEKSDGSAESRVRQEENEVPHDVVNASSSCKSFSAGHKFTLDSHPDPLIEGDEKGEYMITAVSHSAAQPYHISGVEARYSNHFSCIPANIVFRPRRTTPKPIISGIQTGVVTGPAGEEIYTDEYGRIKVFFHWDRISRAAANLNAEHSSCWVRCAQNVAGRKWGFMAIPRIGQEVVIEFLEGDPDRPLVMGGVYNADQMPHYDPVAHKTRTYIKTNSTKGGDGFNELMFEDKADDEMIFVHAQKNMDTRVLNDSTERIFGNRHQKIGWEKDGKKGGDQSETVMQDKSLNIKRDQHEQIEGNYFLTVGHGGADDPGNVHYSFETAFFREVGLDGTHIKTLGDECRETVGSLSVTVGGDKFEEVTGKVHLKTDADYNVGAMNVSSEADMDMHTKAGMNIGMEGGMAVHIKAGLTCIIEAGLQLSLKVGGSFVDINPGGVFISGPLVMINSGGSAGSGGGCKPKPPEAPTAPKPIKDVKLIETEIAHKESTGQKSLRS